MQKNKKINKTITDEMFAQAQQSAAARGLCVKLTPSGKLRWTDQKSGLYICTTSFSLSGPKTQRHQ